MLWHSMTIAQQLTPIYNISVRENKIYVALNVAKAVGAISQQHATRAESKQKEKLGILTFIFYLTSIR